LEAQHAALPGGKRGAHRRLDVGDVLRPHVAGDRQCEALGQLRLNGDLNAVVEPGIADGRSWRRNPAAGRPELGGLRSQRDERRRAAWRAAHEKSDDCEPFAGQPA
jgi:hypothetical protein